MRNFFRKQQIESQLDDEIRAYVDMMTDERIAAGMSKSEARRTSLAEFGGITQVKQAVRDQRAGTKLEILWQDARFGWRQLWYSPAFTLAVVATLALGIGANTAIFSIVDAVVLKPLAYPNADRIVQLLLISPHGSNTNTSIPEFHNWQQQTSIFQEVVAYDRTGPGFNISEDLAGDRPEQVHGIHATEGYFRLFGAPVILGRTFTPKEDSPHGGKVVVLSYDLWQRKFGGSQKAIGKQLWLGKDPYTVIGVLGKKFASDPEAEVWIPFQLEHADTDENPFFQVAGLLKPGITLAQANAHMKLAATQFHRVRHEEDSRQSFAVEPLRDSIIGDAGRSLRILWGAVSLVLLISCANVANLLLVRATARRREFAIRSALGAGRWRIVRQLLTESVILSAAGGVSGLVLGFIGVRALLAISPAGLPRIGENGTAVVIDWRVLGFTLAVSLVTGILFGLFPALSTSCSDLNSSLKEAGKRSGTGFRQSKTRSLLVISEVSLALVMLVGSALLIRTSFALSGVNPGFDSHNVLTLEMSLNGERFQKTAGVAQLAREGNQLLRAVAGVESSAAAFWLPIQVIDGLPFQVIGRPLEHGGSRWMSTSPGYLSVFRIPLLRGRDVNDHDVAGSPLVVLINQALANQYFPNENPLGKQIIIGKNMGPELAEDPREIVGVVGDTHNNGLGRHPEPMVIVPLAQVTNGYTESYTDFQPLIWVVRTRSDPHQLIAGVSEQLRIASGGFPVVHVRTMDEVMGRSTSRESFTTLLFAIFGAVALFLASIGIYGIMAYSVAQRTQEIGIRMALGADRGAIRKLVVWQGMRLAMAGVALGIGMAFGLAHLIAGFLFGVHSWDPAAFVSAPLILSSVALLAVWLPATRASKVDPIETLRAE
ncbi:ABC transporter permease [Acidipila rosea]|uniref:ABC transporter permease n=1 Tax=Acidipila rosea TaxID=768535 RepID=UPI001FB46C65|nr:ABC transporter permease [Acidipila rosea]